MQTHTRIHTCVYIYKCLYLSPAAKGSQENAAVATHTHTWACTHFGPTAAIAHFSFNLRSSICRCLHVCVCVFVRCLQLLLWFAIMARKYAGVCRRVMQKKYATKRSRKNYTHFYMHVCGHIENEASLFATTNSSVLMMIFLINCCSRVQLFFTRVFKNLTHTTEVKISQIISCIVIISAINWSLNRRWQYGVCWGTLARRVVKNKAFEIEV